MPAPAAQPPSRITIVDTVVGRRAGGHQADYLAALEDALRPLKTECFAPFRDGADTALLMSRRKRLKFLLCRFRALTRQSAPAPPVILVLPNPDFIDFVSAFFAVRLRWRAPAATFLFVLRRAAPGVVGRAGWKSRALEAIVRSLARRGHLHPVSDSRSALSAWERLTGVPGSLVSIPVRERPADVPPKSAEDAVVFGLVGLLRPEKGAAFYRRVIDIALSVPGPARIDVQLPDIADDAAFPEAGHLRTAYGGHGSVRFLNGHLDNQTFTRLVSGIDVLVLPYDVESYGTGTSGIMHEVLALGGSVVTTRFAWALEEFGDHPNVFWLDTMTAGHLADRMKTAAGHALRCRGGTTTAGGPDRFRQSWFDALRNARRDGTGSVPG